ncbi:MAG TPA: sugar-binding domain-containing protein, partial [Rectinemataceae bacterium]
MIDHRTYGFREDDYIYAAHPDPSFARRNWLSLDGEWILEHRGSERKIRVPYPIGSELSGVDFRDSGTFIYRRDFEIPGWSEEKRYLLKVGAADYESSVRVNGIELGSHVGGYASFALDMSHALREGTNRIEIEVRDSHSPFQVRGKQTFLRGPFAVWYAGISGIWQPVWVEETGPGLIARAETRVDFVSRRIRVVAYLDIADESPNAARGWELSVSVRSSRGVPGSGTGGSGGEAPDGFQAAHYGERTFLAEYSERDGRFECSFGFDEIGAALWSHSEPNLHAMSLRLSRDGKPSDQVESYFGIREIKTGRDGIRINGDKTFLRMALVQGYYPGGVYAPESYSRMESDLVALKSLGYNGARVHEKVESPYFSYLCDRLGIMTSFEIPSFYLPSSRGFERYASELEELILRDMAHPSCIMRMLFNETWGVWGIYGCRSKTRKFVLAMRDLAKRLDPTRPVIDNSGWEHIRTDIVDVHHYLRSAAL